MKNSIPFKEREDLSVTNDLYECVFIEIDKLVFQSNSNIIIGLMYRIPDANISTFNDYIKQVFDTLKNENVLCYLTGDFNINLFSTESHAPTSEFLDTNFANSYIPMITRPTRVTENTATLIDNIFTNNFDKSIHHKGVLVTDISDHFPIFIIETKLKEVKQERDSFKRFLNQCNIERYRALMQDVNWNAIQNSSDVEEACSSFHKTDGYNKAFPLCKIKHCYINKKKWLTSGMKQSIKQTNQLYALFRQQSSSENKTIYKHYRNKLNSLLRLLERNFYHSILEKYRNNLAKT